MFAKVMYFVLLISCLAITVRAAILGCDPFPASTVDGSTSPDFVRTFRSTCPDSTISWTTGEEALEISASIDKCASASSASVYFSYNTPNQYPMNIIASEQYIYSYSIKWSEEKTHCVVDLTSSEIGANEIVSIDMLDQNGLSNKPTEDLSAFATEKWYTRSFAINGSNIINSANATTNFLRFGFSCFASVSDPEIEVQKAYVKSITFQRVGDVAFRTIYSHNQNCTKCPATAPAILEAYCNSNDMKWEIVGPLNVSTVNFPDFVTVLGDLFTDLIVLNHNTMQVTGCIYPRTPGGVVRVTGIPEAIQKSEPYKIYLGQECSIDNWNIPFPHYFGGGVLSVQIGFVMPPFYFCVECYSLPGDATVVGVPMAVWIIIPVVMSVVVVGLVVGLVWGLRLRRANRRAANLDVEMEVHTKQTETIEH